ncbi:MAG: beta-ketoacyl-ACP synthase II [Caldibacillus sp.]
MRRVVVTGMGIISPLGNDVETFWKNLIAGRSGVKKLYGEEFANIKTQIAAYIEDFQLDSYLEPKEAKRYDLYIQYAYAAALQALKEAEVDLNTIDRERVGVFIGSGVGGIHTLLDNHEIFQNRGPNRVSPFLVPTMISNMAAGFIAIKTGFKGPSYAPVSACATGNQAIGEAYLNIVHGYSDAILAGGSEAVIHPLTIAGFSRMRALSTRNDEPEKASRPFDKNRDGFVVGEGAGVLFLEEYEHAKNRGANILAEIIGYGLTTDAHHITAPDYSGAVRAMQLAITMAGVTPDKVDYINAHATGTPTGDVSETKAIKEVFGEHAYRLKVSSTKSMTGHMFGAAGAAEAIATIKSLQEQIIPPTINLDEPDPECDLDYVPHRAIEANVEIALSNAFGFGGHNAVIALKRF